MPAKRIEMTKKEDLQNLVKSERYVIVKVTATWCGPCKRAQPLIDEWLESLPDNVIYVKVDADKGSEISNILRIRSIPTLLSYINSDPVDVYSGGSDEVINKFFSKFKKHLS
jgi:thioredoxin 1|tara:strand:+ start:34 stop:369 length:336 start_codon:yes stop_codon:yes gene_type:complete